jgi:hypothetical protein
VRKRFALLLVILALAACATNESPAPPSGAASFPSVVTSGAKRQGIAAHYVVETGTNADGQLQLNVRPVQASSILKNARPLADVSVRYPDGSFQAVDASGEFDAGASSYAAKHGQTIKDVNGVVVQIRTPIAIALQPTKFALYVPSAKEEAREFSYYRRLSIPVQSGGGGRPCEASYAQKILAPDDVVTYGILLSKRDQVYAEKALSCDRGDPDTEARIVGFEFISVSDLIRWQYYYQAPGRAELKAAGITQAREYLSFSVRGFLPIWSPRYVTQCGAQGC